MQKRNKAEHALSARPGFVDVSRECAQTLLALITKMLGLWDEFVEGDGLKNRRLRQCKMRIRQVLISRILSACGEVAERLKAAVC